MQRRFLIYLAAMVCAAPIAGSLLSHSKAQEASRLDKVRPRYRVTFTETFGGSDSHIGINGAHVLNNRGTLVGSADTAMSDPGCPNDCFNGDDPFAPHAFEFSDGIQTDLGALPGRDSETSWITANGLISGNSRNGLVDPITGGDEIHGVLWKQGKPTDLGTLDGGTLSLASAVNSSGEVVGLSLNTIQDPISIFGFYQTRAFRWKNGEMTDLGTLGGPDAIALRINERGQIAGYSYIDSNQTGACGPTIGAFLWDKGKMSNLGGLGGTCTEASDMNNRGEVVGFSFLSGDQVAHAFRWDHGRSFDLGTLGGNFAQAIAVNDAGDIAGFSQVTGDAGGSHGVLWSDGHMFDLKTLLDGQCAQANAVNLQQVAVGFSVDCSFDEATFRATISEHGKPVVDLNTLIPANSEVQLKNAVYINDRGEIAVIAGLPDGTHRPVLLVPCDEWDGGNSRCENGVPPRNWGDNLGRRSAGRDNSSPTTSRPPRRWGLLRAWRGARQ